MTLLQEKFCQNVAKLIQKAGELGYTVTLGEAWRTPQQAAWNAEHEKGITHSLHIERLAVDLEFFKDGRLITDGSKLADIGAWWKTLNVDCRWGGDFRGTTACDGGHFSMTPDGVRS